MSDYNPHSALAAWLDTGWQENDTECTLAGCFVRPDEPGSGWGAHFGTGQQNYPWLHSFNSAWDAWAFVFAATGIDAHARLPESVRRNEGRPQPDEAPVSEPIQMRLV